MYEDLGHWLQSRAHVSPAPLGGMYEAGLWKQKLRILFFCDWRLESTWNFVIKHLWLGNSPAAYIFPWFFSFFWFCCGILALYYWDLVVFCFCTLFIQIFDHHSILLQVLEFYYIMKSKYNVNQIEFRYSLLFEDLEKYGFFFFLLKLTVAGLLNGSGQLIRIHFGNIRGLTWKFPHQIVCRAVEEMPYSLTDGEQTIPHCLSIN